MIQRMIGGALSALAAVGVKVAAAIAPRMGLDVFPHRMHAQGKAWTHMDAWRAAPGWFILEAGWTLEVSWKARAEVPAAT